MLLLGSLALFSLGSGGGPRSSLAAKYVMEVVGPLQSLVSSAGTALDRVWYRYFALVNAARHNQELKNQISHMTQQLADMEELRLANGRLRKLLEIKDAFNFPQVAAEVVAVDPSGHFRTAVINKGVKSGVDRLMPVLQHQGVVGRIIWASPHYAKVLLLTDPNSGVDVLVQRTRIRGVVEGAGPDRLRLKYLLRLDDVTPGDVLVTSGAAGVYPKGILVGRVRSVHQKSKGGFLNVDVDPAVDFNRLEEVLVLLSRRSFLD